MDVQKLIQSPEWLKHSGNLLSTEECIILQSSLIILQNENHFKRIYFWGKIIGKENNYYISYGYENDSLSGRIFYYSTDRVNWGLMPKSSPSSEKILKFYTNCFVGDPSFLLDEKILSETKLSAENVAEKLKEEDRLAATVSLIDMEAAILPRGALFKHTNGLVTENDNFQGLNKEECKDLSSYVHFRIPKSKWNTNLLTRDDYSYEMDFLDTIDLDIPRDSWSLQLQDGGRTVIIRNLFWIGMTFIHYIDTPEYYFTYVGYGRRNIDVPFML